LFDAQAPADMAGALPGGNGLAFDWQLLAEKEWPLPWMLSGGLTPDNLAQAAAVTGAVCVDVSSGVEASRGVKDPEKIARFLAVAKSL
jgi:phosphoribosylanthranilate isomerase